MWEELTSQAGRGTSAGDLVEVVACGLKGGNGVGVEDRDIGVASAG
jgi:hypothetical protein